MKTLTSFLATLINNPILNGDFTTPDDVFTRFEKDHKNDIKILYANYENDAYDGYATVLYYRISSDRFYEVYGSHCSCYGLEGQWTKDEEIVPQELFNRLVRGDDEIMRKYEKFIQEQGN